MSFPLLLAATLGFGLRTCIDTSAIALVSAPTAEGSKVKCVGDEHG